MPAFYDETRSRWEQYPPDRFIQQVLNGTLREKVNTTYTVIHVYTQILHQLPATAVMEVQTPGEFEETRLRDLFVDMRDSIATVHEASEDETPTLPSDYTPGDYILHVIHQMRKPISRVAQCAQALQSDADLCITALPELGNRRIGGIVAEILKHTTDITQLLEFSQTYAENLTHHAHTGS